MSREEMQEFDEHASKILNDPKFQKLQEYLAHGNISVMEHSLDVAKVSYRINRNLKLSADLDTLLTGALLHDYYLYDWHHARLFVSIFKMHGYTHPETARNNAVRDFNVDKKTQKVISSHMWPLTFRHFPSSREAAIVCFADKLCALKETVSRW